jgi:hypothetical protein
MTGLSLRSVARIVGGEVVGGQARPPGPGIGPRDRSLSVRLSLAAPDGFLTHSFGGRRLARLPRLCARAAKDRASERAAAARRRPPAAATSG